MTRGRALALALLLALPVASAAQQPSSILLVVGGESGHAERAEFRTAFAEALGGSDRATIRTFDLDLSRPGSGESRRALDARVRERYQGIDVALVVALGDRATEAALRWRDVQWPGANVLCLGSGEVRVPPPSAARTSVIRVRVDPEATLRAALALFPGTKNVALVAGSEARGPVAAALTSVVRAIDARLTPVPLVGLSLPELKRRLAELPADSVVLSAGVELDDRGRRWASTDAHDYFAPAANAPIFTVEGELLGHGVVGGAVLDYASLGREAAARARRLLAGEPAPSLPTADTGSLRLQFDHRELVRWGIADARLPTPSLVVFRPVSFWEEHLGKVVAAGAALLLQSLAITLLLLERRRRRSAEARLQQLSGRLISAQEEERSRIAHDLHDDAGQRLALLAIELDQLSAHALADSARALSADLHRMAHQLHPAILDQLGLLPAARRFAQEVAQRHAVTIEVTSHAWPEALPRTSALVLYRAMQEALQNAIKHSGAARVDVTFRGGGPELTLSVEDQGRGFETDRLEAGLAGLGLAGMRERLRLVGGGFRIESAPNGGTILEVWLPSTGAAAGATLVAS